MDSSFRNTLPGHCEQTGLMEQWAKDHLLLHCQQRPEVPEWWKLSEPESKKKSVKSFYEYYLMQQKQCCWVNSGWLCFISSKATKYRTQHQWLLSFELMMSSSQGLAVRLYCLIIGWDPIILLTIGIAGIITSLGWAVAEDDNLTGLKSHRNEHCCTNTCYLLYNAALSCIFCVRSQRCTSKTLG